MTDNLFFHWLRLFENSGQQLEQENFLRKRRASGIAALCALGLILLMAFVATMIYWIITATLSSTSAVELREGYPGGQGMITVGSTSTP